MALRVALGAMMQNSDTDEAKLREKPRRCFRLAAGLSDRDAAKTIWELGEEVLAQANAIAGHVDVVLEAVKRQTKPSVQ
jgi:hypothetical protein